MLRRYDASAHADVAQLVEHLHGKEGALGGAFPVSERFCRSCRQLYRTCTAVERVLCSTSQRSGPRFAAGLNSWLGAGYSDPLRGVARLRTTCVRGSLTNLVQASARTDERKRSGNSAWGVRSHGAPIHRHGQARFAAPSWRALSDLRGCDRRVLAGARATGCYAPSRSDRPSPGASSRRKSSSAASRGGAAGVRSFRQVLGGVARAARRLGVSLTLGGVR
jgi:hypothetical protein